MYRWLIVSVTVLVSAGWVQSAAPGNATTVSCADMSLVVEQGDSAVIHTLAELIVADWRRVMKRGISAPEALRIVKYCAAHPAQTVHQAVIQAGGEDV